MGEEHVEDIRIETKALEQIKVKGSDIKVKRILAEKKQ
jgi:hypothetical protein